MLAQQQTQLLSFLAAAVQDLVPDADVTIKLERPKMSAHGDIATNLAMQLARPARRNPRELAAEIVAHINRQPEANTLIEEATVAGPGFINFRLTHAAQHAVLDAIASQGTQFGQQPARQDKVMVEFVSANPTGPLHVGHARQAALGDTLCRLLATQGYSV